MTCSVSSAPIPSLPVCGSCLAGRRRQRTAAAIGACGHWGTSVVHANYAVRGAHPARCDSGGRLSTGVTIVGLGWSQKATTTLYPGASTMRLLTTLTLLAALS